MTEQEVQDGVTATRCSECGTVAYPERQLCIACGSAELGTTLLRTGTVSESTLIERAPGMPDWQPRTLATVRTPEGPVILVGVDAPVADGAAVTLFQRGQAPYAVG